MLPLPVAAGAYYIAFRDLAPQLFFGHFAPQMPDSQLFRSRRVIEVDLPGGIEDRLLLAIGAITTGMGALPLANKSLSLAITPLATFQPCASL